MRIAKTVLLLTITPLLLVGTMPSAPGAPLQKGGANFNTLPGAEEIPLSEWSFNDPVVPGYAPIGATYDSDNDNFILRPNHSTPHNTMGWIEGPSITVPEATDNLSGNVAGMHVTYSFYQKFTGFPPDVRLRINSSDFTEYAASGVTPNQFSNLRSEGHGKVTVIFDRRNLDSPDDLQLFIDLFAVRDPGQVDPNFWVRIEKVEFFVNASNSSYNREDLVSAVYMEEDEDLFAHTGGDPHVRTQLRSDVRTFAYDGAFVIALDNRELHAFTSLNGFHDVQVEGGGVISAAISDHHILYLKIDGNLFYYNILTGEKSWIAFDPDFYLVTSGGDGVLIAAEVNFDGNALRYHFLDTREENPSLDLVDQNFEIIRYSTRDTGREPQAKGAPKAIGTPNFGAFLP